MSHILTALAVFCITCSLAAIRFPRALFHHDASKQITLSWDQQSGDFVAFEYSEGKIINDTGAKTIKLSHSILAKGMNNHFVRFSCLKPETNYAFRIKDSEGTSRTYYFTTAPDNPNVRLSFIAGGDSRSIRKTRVLGNKMVAKLKANAVLFNGDFTANDITKQWLEWFQDWELTIASDGRITPMVITRGNHELSNKVLVNLFDVPDDKVLYDTQFGGTLLNVVCLNSEIRKSGKQKRFLKSSLDEHKDYTWQIPQYHRPIRSHVSFKKEMNDQYRQFVPQFEKHENVKLCLENDSHTSKCTWPIVSAKGKEADEGFKRDDEKGIVYVGEGCWGAPLREADDLKSWTRNAEAVNQVNWIFVDQEKIEVRTVLYENADQVSELTYETRFEMPKNINLWTPSNGSLISIKK
jgi:hypothetical protein